MANIKLIGVVWYMQEEVTEKVPYLSRDKLVNDLKTVRSPNVSIVVFVDPTLDVLQALKTIQNPQFNVYDINTINFHLF